MLEEVAAKASVVVAAEAKPCGSPRIRNMLLKKLAFVGY